MTIKNIKQLEAGIYQDAMRAEAEHGLSYVNLNAHLLSMAEAGDFEAGLIRPELVAAGVSPVRQLLAGAGIVLGGLRASSCAVFFAGKPGHVPGAEVLLPALAQEMFEGGLGIQAAGDLSFTSSPGTAGDTVFPADIRPYTDQRQAIPPNTVSVDDLVSVSFGIDSDAYKTARITQDQRGPQNEMGRVTEAADLPLYTIALADRFVRIFKYGGAVSWTYEAQRRMRISKLQVLLEEMAFSEDIRRRKQALAVAVNGDGNANPMILSGTTPAAFSIQNLDEWGIDVAYNSSLGLNMYVGDVTEIKGVRALRYAPNGQVVLNPEQLAMYGGMAYQMPDGSPLKLAPKGSVLDGSKVLLGWNTSRGLEQVIENGSQVTEQERLIRNQTNLLTMSLNIGYGKPWDNSFQAIAHQ